jgi:P-type Ca2+ transporter type 2C
MARHRPAHRCQRCDSLEATTDGMTDMASSTPPTRPRREADAVHNAGATSVEQSHTRSAHEVARLLGTDLDEGLGDDEWPRRLRRLGPNTIEAVPRRSWIAIFLAQFKTLVVLLLLAASVVAFTLEETVEAIAILVVIVINTTIGFVTEWKAARALTALRAQAVAHAHVVRDGRERRVAASELVPGDIVFLEAGEQVPADGRIIESVRLQLDEASLTGESLSVSKHDAPLDGPDVVLAERSNMAFLGTVVTDGRGRMVVTGTGKDTEMGRIGRMLDETDTRDTPLERRLAVLGRSLIMVVVAVAAIIVGAGWLRGAATFTHMLEIGIVLAIAAVPEGLPAVATMTLALGMQRMARRRALIRRLPAVETLGSTTVICTDKTGTLTRGEMTVVSLALRSREIEVTGVGYAPRGELRTDGHALGVIDEELQLVVRIGALCNDAHVDRVGGEELVIGDPTEAALFVLAEKAGLSPATLEREYPRVREIPFDPEAKRMVTVHRDAENRLVAYVKGAPASVLGRCRYQLGAGGPVPLDDDARNEWVERNRTFARRALRVLAFAYRPLEETGPEATLDGDLIFVGMVGMMDPIRPEARTAVARCREAGIRTVMITGDQVETAAEIARDLGLDRSVEGKPLRTVHARELADLDAEGWAEIVSEAAAFARTSPAQKLAIVEALQAQGHVVAMTGDGINDAPALKQADVGVAMGIKGTEVAKQSADMVILDDSFATIEFAVEEGRVIYANILRFARYLFSCNMSTILTVFVAVMVGWPPPLTALQILWINLVVDVISATSLALEPSAPDVMKSPPRDPQEPILGRSTAATILGHGSLIAASTLLVYFIAFGMDPDDHMRAHTTTLAFMTLALAQVFHAFGARSRDKSIFSSWVLKNPWVWGAVGICVFLQILAVSVPLLNRVLHTMPLAGRDWGLVLVGAIAPVLVVELIKLARRLGRKRAGAQLED